MKGTEMKNWELPNAIMNDEHNETTECFIEDLVEHVSKGGAVIIQQNMNVGQVLFTNIEYTKHLTSLIKIDTVNECENVFYNDGDLILNCEVFYSWNLDKGENFLIWWDHDLGDLVLDRTDDFDRIHVDEICKNVYFAWIT